MSEQAAVEQDPVVDEQVEGQEEEQEEQEQEEQPQRQQQAHNHISRDDWVAKGRDPDKWRSPEIFDERG